MIYEVYVKHQDCFLITMSVYGQAYTVVSFILSEQEVYVKLMIGNTLPLLHCRTYVQLILQQN